MKKLLVLILALLTAASMVVFTACKFGNDTSKQSEPENTESSEPADPEESSEPEEPTGSTDPTEPQVTAYLAPGFTAGETGVTFTHETATTFTYKVDDGEWQQGTFVEYSTTAGEHTITATFRGQSVSFTIRVASGYVIEAEELTDNPNIESVAGVTNYVFGYKSKGGAQGVGNATTNAVVSSSILILIFNYIITGMIFTD